MFYWLDAKNDNSWEDVSADDLCTNRELVRKCERKCHSLECRRALSRSDRTVIDEQCGAEHNCAECITCQSAGDSIWSFHVWNDVCVHFLFTVCSHCLFTLFVHTGCSLFVDCLFTVCLLVFSYMARPDLDQGGEFVHCVFTPFVHTVCSYWLFTVC